MCLYVFGRFVPDIHKASKLVDDGLKKPAQEGNGESLTHTHEDVYSLAAVPADDVNLLQVISPGG